MKSGKEAPDWKTFWIAMAHQTDGIREWRMRVSMLLNPCSFTASQEILVPCFISHVLA